MIAAAWDGAGSGGGALDGCGSIEVWADTWQRAGAEGNARWAEAAVAVRV